MKHGWPHVNQVLEIRWWIASVARRDALHLLELRGLHWRRLFAKRRVKSLLASCSEVYNPQSGRLSRTGFNCRCEYRALNLGRGAAGIRYSLDY